MKLIMVGILISMFGISTWLLPSLPYWLPVHWNIQGQVDNYMPKETGVWLLPIMTLIMVGLFQTLPRLDPKQENYRYFKGPWVMMQVGIVTFMGYVHGVILYSGLTNAIPITKLIFMGVGGLFMWLGLCLPQIKQNYFIGYKLPWTLTSEDNWNKTHRYASFWMVGAGIVTLIETLTRQQPEIILGAIMLATIMPVIYSYRLFKKARKIGARMN
jgi:uncharacterized membrane protein